MPPLPPLPQYPGAQYPGAQAWPGFGEQQSSYGQQPSPYGPQPPYGQQSPYGRPPTTPYGPGYGSGPYSYPPYGYGYPKPPSGTNGMAIAAMVLGICGFLFITPIVGLVLGLVALPAIKKSGQRGRGFAISGITLSSVWILLFASFITIGILNQPESAKRDADGNVISPGAVSVFDLHPKDCFTLPPGLIGSHDSKTRTFTVVPCSTPHDSEAFGSFTAAERSYPGVEALRTESTAQCIKILAGYEPDAAALPGGSLVQFVFPDAQAWSVGEHRVTCFVQTPAATLTHTLYRARATYTTDQLRFLDAVRPLSDALSQLNAVPQDADLPVLQERATDIASGARSEVAALSSAPWPAAAQPSVDALVAKHREAAQLWDQAAGEADLDAFGADARQANAAFDMADMQAARAALALPALTPGPAGPNGSSGSTGSAGGSSQTA